MKILNSLVNSSARKLSQVTGKIISMQPVLGNISRLMTRHLYMATEPKVSWNLEIELSDFYSVQQGIKVWKNNVTYRYVNCKKLFVSSLPGIISFSDTSETGWASFSSVDGVISHRI